MHVVSCETMIQVKRVGAFGARGGHKSDDKGFAVQEQLSYPAPICQPTTRQLQFPVSRQAAGAVVQSLLRHHSTPGQLHTPCGVPAWAATGQKRPQPDLDHARCVRQLPAFRSTACRPLACAELQEQSSALPEEVVPGTWSIQVWPVPPNCDMG